MALPDEPITRSEQYLFNIAGEGTTLPNYPITRSEQYLNKIATGEGETPAFPITREEQYLDYIAENGGGGDITVEPLTVTENGTYNPGTGKAYKPVTVNVPEPVIEPLSVTENGTYTAPDGTDGFDEVVVNVQGGAATQEELDAIAGLVGGITTPSTPADIEAQAGDLIDDANTATGEADETLTDAVGTLIDAMPSGSISINANGTVDVAQYAQAVVNVPSGGRTVIGTYVPTSGGINKYITHNAGFDNYVCFIWADANDQSAVEQDAITNDHGSLIEMITWRVSRSPVSYDGITPFSQNEYVGRYNKSSGYSHFTANSSDNTETRTKIGNIYVAGGVTYHYAVCEVILQ